MRLLYSIIIASMCLSCASLAQETIDFRDCESVAWNIDDLYDTQHQVRITGKYRERHISFMNVQIGKELFLLDNKICKIDDGTLVRNLSPLEYPEALFTGDPALDYSCAILDSEGRYLYARGNKTDGMVRINYFEKIDFMTGEIADSVIWETRYPFLLDKDNNLIVSNSVTVRIADLIPGYKLTLPETYSLIFAPKYSKGLIWFVAYSNTDRKFMYYLYDESEKKLSNVTGISVGGKTLPVEGLCGFSNNYLGYVSVDEDQEILDITFYKFKIDPK